MTELLWIRHIGRRREELLSKVFLSESKHSKRKRGRLTKTCGSSKKWHWFEDWRTYEDHEKQGRMEETSEWCSSSVEIEEEFEMLVKVLERIFIYFNKCHGSQLQLLVMISLDRSFCKGFGILELSDHLQNYLQQI